MMNNEIIQLNNQAIAKLQGNHFKDATTLFGDVLRSVKQILVQTEAGACTAPCSNMRTSQDQGILQWTHRSFDGQQDSSSFVFSRPLVFLLPDQRMLSHSYCEQMACGVLFNLALSLHLHACDMGAKGFTLLQKSLSVYERVAEILPSSCILEPVILHNVGLIYQELFQFDQAKLCLELSSAALSTDMAISAINEEDRQSMLMSTTIFQEPPTAAAA